MDNYTKFSNAIFDALIHQSGKLTKSQLAIILYVIRMTDGWNKPQGDNLSISRMAKELGIERAHVSRTIKQLRTLGILEVYEGSTARSVKLMRVSSPESWDLPCVL